MYSQRTKRLFDLSLHASFYIAFAQRRYRFVLGLTTSLGTYLSVFPDAYDDAHIVCLAL